MIVKYIIDQLIEVHLHIVKVSTDPFNFFRKEKESVEIIFKEISYQ